MGLFDWLKHKSPLGLALARGLRTGDVAGELREPGEITVRSKADAAAICSALEEVLAGRYPRKASGTSPMHALTGLFQQVDGHECAAFPVLLTKGLPLLQRLVEQQALQQPEDGPDDVLFALKILALYGTREGASAVVRLAREGFRPGDWMWSVVLGAFCDEHPQAPFVFASLSRPLPNEFISVALLDAANAFLIKGGETVHPFDSDEGTERLARWLAGTEEEQFGYAVSSVAALPFLSHPRRDHLLTNATAHASPEVRLEAAWAAAKLEVKGGLESLSRLCLDVPLAGRARRYLAELGREDLVPEAANDPDFAAQAEFCEWLLHPNELGRPPDELKIVDRRTLNWPPAYETISVWLIAWRARNVDGLAPDKSGIGMVGSRTWCFFSYHLEQRPPEDCYALHCCWELDGEQLAFHSIESGSAEYDGLLEQRNGPPLTCIRMTEVVELNDVLRHPRKLLAVAGAEQSGANGWVVLDGPDSRWYPGSDFPPEENAKTILRIHTGRQLLGFPLAQERKNWLHEKESVPPDRVISGYERLLDRCLEFPLDKQKDLLVRFGSPLSRHFDEYVNSRVAVRGEQKSAVVIETYQRLLAFAEQSPAVPPGETSQPVCDRFMDYVRALQEEGRSRDAMPLVPRLMPLWKDWPSRCGELGVAAFNAGEYDLAESLLVNLLKPHEYCPGYRDENFMFLAEVWLRKGKRNEAGAMMLDCLRRILADAVAATGSDIEFHEKTYQRQRTAILDLIRGGAFVKGFEALPASTLSG